MCLVSDLIFILSLVKMYLVFDFIFIVSLVERKKFCFGKENGYGMGATMNFFVKDTKNGGDHS